MSRPARSRRFVPFFDSMPTRLAPSGTPMDPGMPTDDPPPPPSQRNPMDPGMPSDDGAMTPTTNSPNAYYD